MNDEISCVLAVRRNWLYWIIKSFLVPRRRTCFLMTGRTSVVGMFHVCGSVAISFQWLVFYPTQETLDKYRVSAAGVGLCLRPRLFPLKEEAASEQGSPREGPPLPEEAPSAVACSSTTAKFLPLRHPHGLQGVMQLHEARVVFCLSFCIVLLLRRR